MNFEEAKYWSVEQARSYAKIIVGEQLDISTGIPKLCENTETDPALNIIKTLCENTEIDPAINIIREMSNWEGEELDVEHLIFSTHTEAINYFSGFLYENFDIICRHLLSFENRPVIMFEYRHHASGYNTRIAITSEGDALELFSYTYIPNAQLLSSEGVYLYRENLTPVEEEVQKVSSCDGLVLSVIMSYVPKPLKVWYY